MSRALRAVALRARLQRALDAWVALATLGLAFVSVGVLTNIGQTAAGPVLGWSALVLPFLGALGWALGPLSPLPMARAIDRALGTPDLIASALELSARPVAERSAFERACIGQADVAVVRLRASDAWPFVVPRGTQALCALAIVWLSLTGPQPSTLRRPPPSRAAHAPQLLEADSMHAFAAELATVKSQPLSKEARDVAEQLNRLLESLARGELDRAAALAKLRALEERLESVLAEDPAAFEAALERMAKALEGSREAGPLAAALAEQPALAPQALEQLGQSARLLKPKAAEQLASALERAAQARGSERTKEALEAAKRELDRLQKQRDEAGAQAGERADRLLKKKQRELEQLARDQASQETAERQLERLQRELDAASRALENDQQQAAQDALQQAARAMEQAASGQRERGQAQRLSEQLAQLRAELGQQGAQGGQRQQGSQSGQGEALSMQRFGQLARGQQGQAASEGQQGQQGTMPSGAQPGQAESEGQAAAVMMQLAQSGAAVGSSAKGQSQQAGARGGEGEDQGAGAGEGGEPQSGAATQGSGAHVDTRIEGERRAGPTRSEIIYESGQRGFASGDYAKVHDDYARHAEGVIERQQIPSGYRFYVRRYFQLIRPRENTSP